MQRGLVETLLYAARSDRVISRAAQHHLHGTDDLRLVVDDEHDRTRRAHDTVAPEGAAGGAGAPWSPSGNWTTKAVLWPGTDSTVMCPPLASTKPLAIASPSPEPLPRSEPGGR